MPSNILLPLVPSLTGLLLKSWAGDAAAAVGQKLTEQATGWLGSAHKRRRAENRAREIAEAALDELEPLLTHELKALGLTWSQRS